jgi:hypothetical protein
VASANGAIWAAAEEGGSALFLGFSKFCCGLFPVFFTGFVFAIFLVVQFFFEFLEFENFQVWTIFRYNIFRI